MLDMAWDELSALVSFRHSQATTPAEVARTTANIIQLDTMP